MDLNAVFPRIFDLFFKAKNLHTYLLPEILYYLETKFFWDRINLRNIIIIRSIINSLHAFCPQHSDCVAILALWKITEIQILTCCGIIVNFYHIVGFGIWWFSIVIWYSRSLITGTIASKNRGIANFRFTTEHLLTSIIVIFLAKSW